MTNRFVFPYRKFISRFKRQFSHARKSVKGLIRLAKSRGYRGNGVSRALRFVFENKRVKKLFGFNLTAVALFTGIATQPISAFSLAQAEVTTVSPAVIDLTTNRSVHVPTASFHLNQGYSLFHRGVDLEAAIGEPVYPIMDGVIESTLYSPFSYGNHIITDHGGGFKSLYAHLSKIIVKPGQRVDKNTVIGLVGTTGWATGPHLHLEIFDNDKNINPLTILPTETQ